MKVYTFGANTQNDSKIEDETYGRFHRTFCTLFENVNAEHIRDFLN